MNELYIAQAADKIGPRTGAIWAGTVSVTSHPYDIRTLLPLADGRIVAIYANVDIFYRWADTNTDVVDGTAVSPSPNVGFPLVAGNVDEHVPMGKYLVVQGNGNGIVWLAVTSGKCRKPNPPTPVPVNT
jgi:hypothetical protein